MIYTVTLNPAIDRTVFTNIINKNDVTRVQKTIKQAAGKGINVSNVINMLNGKSVACGIIAGNNGKYIIESLNQNRINSLFISVEGETRENIKVIQTEKSNVIELNEQGPICTLQDVKSLQQKIDEIIRKEDFIIFCGSIPQGVPKTIYSDLIRHYKNKGVYTVLDTSGELLREGIKAKPSLIKPNEFELQTLLKRSIETDDEVITAAQELVKTGISEVIVSRGSKGAIYINDKNVIRVNGHKLDVKNTVGAGDALLGGFMYAKSKNFTIEESLKFAVKVASSSILDEGTGPKVLPNIEYTKRPD